MIAPVEIGGAPVRPDTYVWILASDVEHFTVEYRNQVATLPRDVVLECPVQGPSLEQLRALDECFVQGRDAFEDEHVDAENYFVIQRCRAHGRRFLRDTRGTVAMYERLTLLDADEGQVPEAVWRRYHAMSDDWLVRQGRTR